MWSFWTENSIEAAPTSVLIRSTAELRGALRLLRQVAAPQHESIRRLDHIVRQMESELVYRRVRRAPHEREPLKKDESVHVLEGHLSGSK